MTSSASSWQGSRDGRRDDVDAARAPAGRRAREEHPPILPIGDDATDEHEEQDGKLREEGVEAEIEVRLRQVEHEPRLRVVLHPRADRGAERREPEQTVVAVRERARDALQPASSFFRFGRNRGSRRRLSRHV